jgi:hypothetical protein
MVVVLIFIIIYVERTTREEEHLQIYHTLVFFPFRNYTRTCTRQEERIRTDEA